MIGYSTSSTQCLWKKKKLDINPSITIPIALLAMLTLLESNTSLYSASKNKFKNAGKL
jgi:hypothetical protein